MGQMSVRDTHGYWYELKFDVSSDWELMGECDGCGQLSHKGENIGEVCLDFSSVLEWEDRPW